MFSVASEDDRKRQSNDYIDRPDTVTVGPSNYESPEADYVYEVSERAEPAVYEETNIDAGNYEELGRRDTKQPVYQHLVKDKTGRTPKVPANTGRQATPRK